LVHRKTKKEINLQSFYLRESYVDAFSEGLKLQTNLVTLNLSRNQLTSNRLIKVLFKLPKTLKELILNNNPDLASEAYRVLGEDIIDKPGCKLEKLELEGCRINDTALRPIVKALEYNTSLKFVNLSRNQIREPGALDIAKMIEVNTTLVVFFLHWNKL